jgi:hypothetical protein
VTRQRVTVADAAEMLGISQDAVRMRVKRGKLEGDKEGNRLLVWIDPDQTEDQTSSARFATDELLEAYRDEITFLRRELERKDHLLAAALERIPAIEAPPEPRGSPETAEEEPERGEARPAGGEAQEGAEKTSPWWRRVFGG